MPTFKAGARKNTNEPIFKRRDREVPLAASTLADISKVDVEERKQSSNPFHSGSAEDRKRKLNLDAVIENFQKKAKPASSSQEPLGETASPQENAATEEKRMKSLLDGVQGLAAKGMKINLDEVVTNFQKRRSDEGGSRAQRSPEEIAAQATEKMRAHRQGEQDAGPNFTSKTADMIAETKRKLEKMDAPAVPAIQQAPRADPPIVKASGGDAEARGKREMMERILAKVRADPSRQADADLLQQALKVEEPVKSKLEREEEEVIQQLQAHQEAKKKQDVLDAIQAHQDKQQSLQAGRDDRGQSRRHREMPPSQSSNSSWQNPRDAAPQFGPQDEYPPQPQAPGVAWGSQPDLQQACQDLVSTQPSSTMQSLQGMAEELQNSRRRQDVLQPSPVSSLPANPNMPRRRTPAEIIAGVEQAEREVAQSCAELNVQLKSVRRSPQDIMAGIMKKCGEEVTQPTPGIDPTLQMFAEMQGLNLFPDVSQAVQAAAPLLKPMPALGVDGQLLAPSLGLDGGLAGGLASVLAAQQGLALPGMEMPQLNMADGYQKLLQAHLGAASANVAPAWQDNTPAKKADGWQDKKKGQWQDSGWQEPKKGKWKDWNESQADPNKDERWHCWEGDWICTSCDVIVFSYRNNCATCQLPKELGAAPDPALYRVSPSEQSGWVDYNAQP